MTPSRPQSPLPWKADLSTIYWMSPYVDQHSAESDMDNIVCSVINRNDAKFICEAVNNFTPMFKLLEEAACTLQARGKDKLALEIYALLAKLEGGK